MFRLNKKAVIEKLQGKNLVFWGSGRIGKYFFERYCKKENIIPNPIFWCDSNKEVQGQSLFDIEVISPENLFEIAQREYLQNNNMIVIITAMGINMLEMISYLEKNGYRGGVMSVLQINSLIYFEENRDKVEEILYSYADDKSRNIYKAMIDNMTAGRCVDFSLLDENQYFNNDVIKGFSNEEVLVDAGVCNGEEIDKMLNINSNIIIHAFEPDKKSWKKLKVKYKNTAQVSLYPFALWDKKTSIGFQGNEAVPSASRLEEDGNACDNSIEAVRLDDVISGKVSFIKMDIEGAELNALKGAEEIIKKYHPKLAICVYHNISDYIEIPLLIKQMNPDYKFYFRQHSVTSGESVFYAI